MIAIPTWIGAASRFLRRGSFYFLPPIRLNIPVNIHAGSNKQILKIGTRVLTPEDIYEVEPVYEWKWPIPGSDWTTVDITQGQFEEMTARFGEPEQRVFGARLTIRSTGEMIWLDRKQYWRLQGFLMQIGVDI